MSISNNSTDKSNVNEVPAEAVVAAGGGLKQEGVADPLLPMIPVILHTPPEILPPSLVGRVSSTPPNASLVLQPDADIPAISRYLDAWMDEVPEEKGEREQVKGTILRFLKNPNPQSDTLFLTGKFSQLPDIFHLNFINDKLYQLNIINCTIAELPPSITAMKILGALLIKECPLLRELPKSIGNLTKLKLLYLSLSGLERLPESIGALTQLKALNLSGCVRLVSLPESIGDYKELAVLILKDCSGLVELPKSIGQLTKLLKCDLLDCTSLREIPEEVCSLQRNGTKIIDPYGQPLPIGRTGTVNVSSLNRSLLGPLSSVDAHTMPPKTIEQAISSVRSVTTPGGIALAGFEIRQLPDVPSPLVDPSTVVTIKKPAEDWSFLVPHAESLRITEFKELLFSIPEQHRAMMLRQVLKIFMCRENKEAFEFVLKHVPDPARTVRDILSTSIGEVYYDVTQSNVEESPESIEKRFNERMMREKDYQFVINCVREVYPDVDDYITHITSYKDRTLRGFLSPNGIRLIIDELKSNKSKGEFRETDCIVCDSLADAAQQMKDFVAKGDQAAKGCCFIVRIRSESMPSTMHVQPIYIERLNSTYPFEYDSIILDSTGTTMHAFALSDYLTEKNIDLPIRFLGYRTKRQIDGSNCSIFSIRDALEIARDPAEVMKFAQQRAVKLGPYEGGFKNKFIFDLLPPNFMLPTQSRTVLTEYLAQHRQITDKDEALLTQHKKTTLNESVIAKNARHVVRRVVLLSTMQGDREVFEKKDVFQNVYIERKYRKYQRNIIANVIKMVIAKRSNASFE